MAGGVRLFRKWSVLLVDLVLVERIVVVLSSPEPRRSSSPCGALFVVACAAMEMLLIPVVWFVIGRGLFLREYWVFELFTYAYVIVTVVGLVYLWGRLQEMRRMQEQSKE